MNQKDKELLFKDLCARLPYNVKVKVECGDIPYAPTILSKLDIKRKVALFNFEVRIENCKPYLRPMSSMTEEEKREIYDWLVENDVDWFDFSKLRLDEILISFDSSWLLVNWLLKNHFDYHGLIEKGLAIEVTKENNPYKE